MIDALIVGAGPVGLAMAADLARYGLSVRIIDQAAAPSVHSKALVLWSRTLELLDRAGWGDSFVQAGLKVRAAVMMAGDRHIAQIGFDDIATPHPYALMLPQSDTERLLAQHLQGLGVTVERGCALLSFRQAEDHVEAALGGPGGAAVVRAGWLIGCDGAHSTVRHALGLDFEGDTMPSDWVLADVHLAGLRSPPDQLTMFWHEEGVLALFPITGDRYRVIADLGTPAGAPPHDPNLAEIQALLDRRGPGGVRAANPVWLSGFRINERKVADYRVGRVFLAGDAAHIHSPAGGQGMNTGLQDAFNLAWKLALVRGGRLAAEPLLGSYNAERSAIGRQVLTDAGRLTRLALLKGGLPQAIRNHAAALLFGLAPLRHAMADKLAELSLGYPHSPLTRASHAHPAPGARAPIRLADTPVGATPRFALFAAANDAAGLIAAHPDLLEPAARPSFTEQEITLVRPDGYIAMVARQAAEVTAYLAEIGATAVRP